MIASIEAEGGLLFVGFKLAKKHIIIISLIVVVIVAAILTLVIINNQNGDSTKTTIAIFRKRKKEINHLISFRLGKNGELPSPAIQGFTSSMEQHLKRLIYIIPKATTVILLYQYISPTIQEFFKAIT